MIPISIFHNVTLGDHGYPTKGMLDGWGKGDTLDCVFAFSLDTDMSHLDLLDRIFYVFNEGDNNDLLAAAYRRKHLRSLSVGDVVMISGVSYACQRVGWKEIDEYPPKTFPDENAIIERLL